MPKFKIEWSGYANFITVVEAETSEEAYEWWSDARFEKPATTLGRIEHCEVKHVEIEGRPSAIGL